MNLVNIMKWLSGFLRNGVMVLISLGVASPLAMGAHNAVQKIVKQNCGACHGINGNSVAPIYPKLAAQTPAYITKQLHDFTDGVRTSPVMSGIAKALSNTQIQQLAQYFSQQTNINKARPNIPLVAQGEKIFRGGVIARGVPACAACHGPAAIGLPPLYPRLAGQNPPYVESQLLAFRSKKRSNDLHAMMRDIAGKLTAQQIKAVAAYLGSLP